MRDKHKYQVAYVDDYGLHCNLEVFLSDAAHSEAHAEERARRYLARPLKYVKATYRGTEKR